MANRIRILPDELANKIAAGEVIERPASVVKELVENALDAACSQITVRIKAAGAQLIAVEDDGLGMSPDDAVAAFHRHATSKIRDASDLEAIRTFGFRGEALPSVAAVSRVELSTREEGRISGTLVIAEGSRIETVEDTGRAIGTTVAVKNLFFNTPARRKFLKSGSTELRHITRVLVNTALAYPAIGLALFHNDRELFRWPKAEGLKERLVAIYGMHFLDSAVPLSHQEGAIFIEGWIGKPEAARSSRIHQFLFVNKRPIGSSLLSHAVFDGYQRQLPQGKYPLVVLFLEVPSERLDVNVHPTKKEIRFADERSVHQAVLNAVRKALGQKEAVPQWRPSDSQGQLQREIEARFPFLDPMLRQDVRRSAPVDMFREGDSTRLIQLAGARDDAAEIARDKPVDESARPDMGAEAADKVTLWQLHRKYILAQIKDGAVIIDQHAAHERILYEMAKKRFAGERGAGQQLLFPLTLELSFEELAAMAEAMPLFQQLGFSIKLFGGNTVVVEAIPAMLRQGTGERLISDILDMLQEDGQGEVDLAERMAMAYACKTAIKDGDALTQEEMSHLIDMLFATHNPFTCPHGRPTFIRMPLNELDRKFKR